MIKKRIISRIDIKNEFVIKGIHLEGLRKVGDPNQLALKYFKEGIDEILFMDAVASYYDRNNLSDLIKVATKNIFVPITVGGGIRTIDNIRELLLAGADKVSINTAAVKDINFIKEASKKFGAQCMVVAVDAKKVSDGKWEIFTHGGRKKTGIDAIEFSKKAEANGAGEILLTSMDKDGTKTGYDIELLNIVTKSISIPVIASGGAGNLEHLYDAIKKGGASAVLAASIFHYGEYTIKETKEYLKSKNVPIRI